MNLQRYKGAIVDEAGVKEFYRDYEVKSISGRVHYYFSEDYLQYIRDGHKLIKKASVNNGLLTSGSWFAGLNLDQRSIKLPNLVTAHEDKVKSKGLDYESSLSAFFIGPLVRGKLGFGPAYVAGGSTTVQVETAFNLGFVFMRRHLVSIGIDIYQVNFRSKSSDIGSVNYQGGIFYTYSFM